MRGVAYFAHERMPLQVLEGEAREMDALTAKIGLDSRHEGERILWREVGPRQFGEWSMGYQNLSDLRLVETGESDEGAGAFVVFSRDE